MTTMSDKIPQIVMNQGKKLRYAAIVGIVTAFLFVILSTINMYIYPGSFHIAYNVFPYPHYSFIYNNLSDMGMLHTFTGESNYLSAALFAFTLTLTGTGFLIYVRYFPRLFDPNSKSYKNARVGSILGIISSAAFIAIGWTPWNILVIPHMIFVFIGFVFSVIFNIFFAVAILRDKSYPNLFGMSLVFYALVIVGYLFALIFGPEYGSLAGRVVESLGQKIVVYTQMLVLIINATGHLFLLRKKK